MATAAGPNVSPRGHWRSTPNSLPPACDHQGRADNRRCKRLLGSTGVDLRNREVRENCRILATVGKDPLELPPLQADAQAPVPVLGVEITPGSPKFEYIARKLGGLLILYLESLSKSKETPTTIICGTSLHNREGQPAYLLLFLGAWSTYEFNSYSFSFASPERVERFRLLASSCVFLGAVGYPVHEFDVAQANTRRLEVLKSVVTTLILDLEI